MRNFAIAGVAALAIAASTAVYAQHRWFHDHMQMSSEDRAAFTDARIAAVKAGLKLNPDQEKLWPPVETAVRDFAKLRIDRANARMNAQKNDSQDAQKQDSQNLPDPVARLRERADTMAIPAAFSFSLSAGYAGDIRSTCWTSGGRFAKRRPLAKAFPGRFRAHSSVGRADDS